MTASARCREMSKTESKRASPMLEQ
jgi:hypothetical protein